MDEKQLSNFYNSINNKLSFLNDVSLNADGEATIKLITQTINKESNTDFIKKCVAVIDSISRNDFEFCKNLFEISCALIKYRRDPPGHEIVFTPMLLMRVGKGDCKKFTTWICSVLKCKGIQSANKVVSYDPEYGWQHIYAIAFYPNNKGYITLDPVNYEEFNQEVKYQIGRVNFYDGSKSKLIMAKLSIMGNVPEKNQTFLGIGEAADDILGDLEEISGKGNKMFRHVHEAEQMYINGICELIDGDYDGLSGLDDGIGKPKIVQKVKAKVEHAKQKAQEKKAVRHSPEKKQERKEKRQKIIKGAKNVGFAPTRAAFLALIAAGGALAQHTPIKFNLAVKIAQLWQKDNGKSMTEIWQKFGGKREALKNAIVKASHIQIAGIGVAPGVITAAVVTAAPILAFTIKALSNTGVVSKADAASASNLVDDVAHANTNAEGVLNPELQAEVSKALPFVQEAIKTDDGGDKQAQRQIVQTTTPNDQQTIVTPASTPQAFNAQSDGQDQQAAKTANTTDTPTEDTPATNAAGFNLLNASSWLTGSIQFPLGLSIVVPGHEIITTALSSLMFTVSMYLFLKQKFKTKTIKP
jgi:hypothetical protein